MYSHKKSDYRYLLEASDVQLKNMYWASAIAKMPITAD